MATNGVKVTYIETQFVTSDAASFKSLVQRLTGKYAEPTEPARQPHRPLPRRAGADGRDIISGAQSYCMSTSPGLAGTAERNAGASQFCDYPELLYVGASERHHGGSYSDLLY